MPGNLPHRLYLVDYKEGPLAILTKGLITADRILITQFRDP